MLTSIISAMFVAAVIAAKPIVQGVERAAKVVKTTKEYRAAREVAMAEYLERDIMDIEH